MVRNRQELPWNNGASAANHSRMVATVEILTGEKSVLDYLIKPAPPSATKLCASIEVRVFA